MSLKQRLQRLWVKAEEGGVLIRQQDGSVRVFEVMGVQREMFLAQMDLLRDIARESAVLDAVRGATGESRASFEERFGPIVMVEYIIASPTSGGWVEAKTLTEDGRVERVLYEGGFEEAEYVREGAKSGGISSELPRPPVAGRWVDGRAEDLSE
jgi:hypothetical protein